MSDADDERTRRAGEGPTNEWASASPHVDAMNVPERDADERTAGNPSRRPTGFTCPQCGITSHNPNDVTEKYCGRCHLFIGELR